MVTASRYPNPTRRRKEEEKENQPQSENEEDEEEELRHLFQLRRYIDSQISRHLRRRRSRPDWQNLPSDVLQLLFNNHISSSITDLLSFSAVCTSWRSQAKSSSSSSSSQQSIPFTAPPLLLSSSMSRLQTLNPHPQMFRSRISKRALDYDHCCGCSFGHLIFAATSKTPVLIADVFSSAEFHLPKPPPGFTSLFTHGVLTAPPSSPSSMLFLIGSGKLLIGRLPPEKNKIWSLSTFDYHFVRSILVSPSQQLYVLHMDCTLTMSSFDPIMRRLIMISWILPDVPCTTLHSRLAYCGGDILLLRFIKMEDATYDAYAYTWTIEIYKLGFREHVRVYSIGDWCLFMDGVGCCPLACPNPRKWGGESDCIYIAEPGSSNWVAAPLNGTRFKLGRDTVAMDFNRWPYPTWVYPSMLL